MKNIAIVVLMLFGAGSAFAQQDLINKYEKQVLTIDSLKKVIATAEKASLQLEMRHRESYKSFQDSIKNLDSNLFKLKRFKANEKTYSIELKQKTDSIGTMKAAIYEKDKQISSEIENGRRIAAEEKEKGKKEILNVVFNNYKSKSFDDFSKIVNQTVGTAGHAACREYGRV